MICILDSYIFRFTIPIKCLDPSSCIQCRLSLVSVIFLLVSFPEDLCPYLTHLRSLSPFQHLSTFFLAIPFLRHGTANRLPTILDAILAQDSCLAILYSHCPCLPSSLAPHRDRPHADHRSLLSIHTISFILILSVYTRAGLRALRRERG